MAGGKRGERRAGMKRERVGGKKEEKRGRKEGEEWRGKEASPGVLGTSLGLRRLCIIIKSANNVRRSLCINVADIARTYNQVENGAYSCPRYNNVRVLNTGQR